MSANGDDRLRFGVLGPLRAWDGERRLDLGAPQQQAVLAVLVVHAGQVVSREEVMDWVWGDGIPPSVVNVVQSYVARLRRVLEPGRPIRATCRRRPPAAPPGYRQLLSRLTRPCRQTAGRMQSRVRQVRARFSNQIAGDLDLSQ